MNAVACAYAEDLPVIAISGGINSESEADGEMIHHALGEVRYDYQRQIYEHVTAGAFAVRRLDDAPAAIDRAIATALCRRKPVYLEISCNLAALAVPAPAPRGFQRGPQSDPAALSAAVAHATELLASATRPVLVAGPRIRPPEAQAAFRSLADAAGYAVAIQPAAKAMFPENHPAYAGLYWGPVSSPGVAAPVESADAYLFAGGLLSDYSTTGYSALIDPKKLLLANPDEVRLLGARYTGVVAGRLPRGTGRENPTQPGLDSGIPPRPGDPGRRLQGRHWFRFGRPADNKVGVRGGPVIARRPDGVTGRDWRLLVQRAEAEAAHGLPVRNPVPGRLDRLVASRPRWVTSWAAEPTRVLAIIGDGSFQLTAQEVSTMVRYGARPIIVLVNNRGYTIEAEIHDGPYNRIKNWDYAGLMEVFNAGEGKGLGLHAATAGELDRAIDRALAHDGPCLIEVPIDPHDCSPELREWGSRVAVANGRAPRIRQLGHEF